MHANIIAVSMNTRTTAKRVENWELYSASKDVDGEAIAGLLYVYRGGSYLSAQWIANDWWLGTLRLPQKAKHDVDLSLDKVIEHIELAHVGDERTADLDTNFKIADIVNTFRIDPAMDWNTSTNILTLNMYYGAVGDTHTFEYPYDGSKTVEYATKGWFWDLFPGCDFGMMDN